MYISGINYESIVDGEGVRVVIYISGCKHNCKMCQNPDTHNFKYGKEFTIDNQYDVINYIADTPFIAGLTISGGDPMYSAKELLAFIQRYKRKVNNSIWIYTGFTYEEILKDEDMFNVLKEIDILVDGLFIEEEKSPLLNFKGSKNQRVIDVQKSIKSNKVIEYDI